MRATCLRSGETSTLSDATATRDLGLTEWVNEYCYECEKHHWFIVDTTTELKIEVGA